MPEWSVYFLCGLMAFPVLRCLWQAFWREPVTPADSKQGYERRH